MKSTELGDSAVTGGIDDSSNFGFVLDAHAYKLFADSLYSDKQLAPLREYTTNAIDSLIESGNEDKGYIVHLPNRLEPFWSIRDFGLGIDDVNMPNLFCFNKSDKRDTNKLNGTFGLGSKAFLSVSDTATFTSYYNGMKYVYFVFKDKGMPTFTRIEECETDEENGLEVKIPIDNNHFYAIIDKYKTFCRYVTIKPTVIGHDKTSWDNTFTEFERETVDLGNNCSFGGVPEYGDKGKPILVFGNVSYKLNRFIDEFNFIHIPVMHVPIGSVDIVPSREELAMTDKTLDYINTIGETFRVQVNAHIQAYYTEHGFIDTINYVTKYVGRVSDFPINGKRLSVKVNITHKASNDTYSNKVKYNEMYSEYGVTYQHNVLLNFEEKVKRFKPRVREYALNNRGTVVVINDPVEAMKYCDHFEIDISTLTHLKDITPPALKTSTFDLKGYRFTGLRKLNRYGSQIECPELDMSDFDTIHYVYRKNSKLFRKYAEGVYSNECSCEIELILRDSVWNTTDVYALTYRQVQQCIKAGVETVNIIDHVFETVDLDILDKTARYIAFDNNSYKFNKFENNILMLDIIPEMFHFMFDIKNSEEYKAFNSKGRLYMKLKLGTDLITKYEREISNILQGDVGAFFNMFNHSYSNNLSDEMIDIILTQLGVVTKQRLEAEAEKAKKDAE